MRFVSAFCSCRFFFKTVVFILVLVFASPLFAQTGPVRELAPGVFYYFGDELEKNLPIAPGLFSRIMFWQLTPIIHGGLKKS
jgi:hypothetical protein